MTINQEGLVNALYWGVLAYGAVQLLLVIPYLWMLWSLRDTAEERAAHKKSLESMREATRLIRKANERNSQALKKLAKTTNQIGINNVKEGS